ASAMAGERATRSIASRPPRGARSTGLGCAEDDSRAHDAAFFAAREACFLRALRRVLLKVQLPACETNGGEFELTRFGIVRHEDGALQVLAHAALRGADAALLASFDTPVEG